MTATVSKRGDGGAQNRRCHYSDLLAKKPDGTECTEQEEESPELFVQVDSDDDDRDGTVDSEGRS